MKNLIFIVLVVVIAIAGYNFVNKSTSNAEIAVVVDEATVPMVNNDVVVLEETSEKMDTVEAVTTGEPEEEISMIVPADLSKEAQNEIFTPIGEYNKCMLQNRLEYHQQGNNAEQVANKTMASCETYLDTLAATLVTHNINKDLSRGMVMTMRKRAARKLMSAVTNSLAGQAAAIANPAPVAPVTTP